MTINGFSSVGLRYCLFVTRFKSIDNAAAAGGSLGGTEGHPRGRVLAFSRLVLGHHGEENDG